MKYAEPISKTIDNCDRENEEALEYEVSFPGGGVLKIITHNKLTSGQYIYRKSHKKRHTFWIKVPDLTFNENIEVNTAISDESKIIKHEYLHSFMHFWEPYSTKLIDPLIRFNELKTEWEIATAHLSTITQMSMHPAYQQIIKMGKSVIPYILIELRKQPNHWFWALKSITGHDPIKTEDRGHVQKMAEGWLHWGKEQGYLR